jgi:RND superfamily putative drug exporter
MLSWLGQKGWTEKGRVPYLGGLRHRNHGESRVWGAILDRVLERPAISATLATLVLLALAVPAFAMHTINPGVAGLPRSLPIMQTYDRIQAAFPGGPLPALIAVQADDVNAPEVQAGIAKLRHAAAQSTDFGQPVTVQTNPRHDLAIVSLPMAGDGTNKRSEAALADLRDGVIPQTIGRVPGVRTEVTGMTAGSKDFNDTLKAHLPIVFAFVLGLAFILLLVTFRSIVVPIKAILLNLLSVGAAYGILTLVFQDGHLEGLLDFTSQSAIESSQPVLLFAVAFGLSTDYGVFLLGRIKELHDSGLSNEEAVALGLQRTGRIVTFAAALMVIAIGCFVTSSIVFIKQLGFGTAVAVLIDATIVRALLVPALMRLLGDWNWWMPDWLDRILPHVAYERPVSVRRA